jgi:hypothetical protein
MAGTIVANTLNTDTAGAVFTTNNALNGIAKAWVNFTGSTAVINSSFNVASITRASAGDYTVNFTTAMSNATYVAVASSQQTTSTTALVTWAPRISGLAIGSFKVSGVPENSTSGAVVDVVEMRCVVFGS